MIKSYRKDFLVETSEREVNVQSLLNEKADLVKRLAEIDADLVEIAKVK